VKTLRLALLLLLAVLLPVRGALAVAMACAPAADGGGHVAMVAPEATAQMAGCHTMAAEPAADAPADTTGQPHHGSCHLCAALCSLTPMPADVPGVVASPQVADAAFARLHATAPHYESGGLERPPRSC